MAFTTRHVAAYFKRVEPTIRKWSVEFADYLSPTGAPEKGKSRQFTIEDMKVFDLIADMRDSGNTYEEIHMALKSGNRGNAPDVNEQDLRVLQATEGERRVTLEVEALQRAIVDMRRQLTLAETKAAQLDEANITIAKLETSLSSKVDNLSEAKTQLEVARQEVIKLSKQLGEEYIRGVMDTLQRMGQLPKEQGGGGS